MDYLENILGESPFQQHAKGEGVHLCAFSTSAQLLVAV